MYVRRVIMFVQRRLKVSHIGYGKNYVVLTNLLSIVLINLLSMVLKAAQFHYYVNMKCFVENHGIPRWQYAMCVNLATRDCISCLHWLVLLKRCGVWLIERVFRVAVFCFFPPPSA